MSKEEITIESEISRIAKKFLEKTQNKHINIISHFDTDGISSATIMLQTLKKLDRSFDVKIVKTLEKETIKSIPKENVALFLDLGSGSLDYIKNSEIEEVYIIDHHEIVQEIPESVEIINPELHKKQKISGSGLTYLFCKELDEETKDFAKLAVLGMIGDTLEREIDNLNHDILNDGEIQRKRGLLIYPSTRPINRTLEYCSNPFIPGVTGDTKGVLELLREAEINPINGRYKTLIELDDEEMERLVTAIMLRNPKTKNKDIIGDIFLIKIFNRLEDARELSAMINACSRMDNPNTAIQFCMEITEAKKKAESIHAKYKQHLVSGLRHASETQKTQGKGYVIMNAGKNIKDTIIGTIASIMSNSSLYEEGTIIITMAQREEDKKIKVSARSVGDSGRNLRKILEQVTNTIEGEVGGHKNAAGAVIPQEKEEDFIEELKKSLEIEVIKVKNQTKENSSD
ncbi:MAG: DHHA1 domain-containing protein [Minisyncoccales bacterium]